MNLNNNTELETAMIRFYESLSEKDRRRYAAIEVLRGGYGSSKRISSLFGCDEKTILRGKWDLSNDDSLQMGSVREPGGGRKPTVNKKRTEDLDNIFLDVIENTIAGDPMDESLKWTNMTRKEIANEIGKRGISVSKNIVKQLLKKHKFVKRKMQKTISTGQSKDRDMQFNIIKDYREKYMDSGNPIISIDTKKKELIGNLYREGRVECVESIKVFDHDFPHLAEGKIVPYTIYDLKNNEAFTYIGTSADTSEFVCDALKAWWNSRGKKLYPNATSVLCLADSGGSNSYRHHLFKESLQKLSNQLSLDLRMSHYPPYTSKWNPVEHRVFPHITRSMSGVVLSSIDLVKTLIKKTTTTKGLRVFAQISKKIYKTKRKVASDFYEYANLSRDNILGHLNYMLSPNIN